MVCLPSALVDAPAGWAAAMLRDGEPALLPDAGEMSAIDAVAQQLDLLTVRVVRREATQEKQEQTVIAHAGSLPCVWVARNFSAAAREWATDRGQMTLLVEVSGALSDEERRRIDRFVALLGRQAE